MQPVAHPCGRIGRLESTFGRERGKRITGAPERLCGLPGAQLAAVPDALGIDLPPGRIEREQLSGCPAPRGEGAHRIDVRRLGISMMNEINHRDHSELRRLNVEWRRLTNVM